MADYTKAIRAALLPALCLRDFPSELVEKHIKPEIEVYDTHQNSKPLIMMPILIARSEREKCLIESSINSTRISLTIKQLDEQEKLIVSRFASFFSVRADLFEIVRKKPRKDYDVSFLICNSHLEKFDRDRLIDFIIEFIETIEKDVNEIKLNIITQTRIAATYFMHCLANPGKD